MVTLKDIGDDKGWTDEMKLRFWELISKTDNKIKSEKKMFGTPAASKVAGFKTEADQYMQFTQKVARLAKALEALCIKHDAMLNASFSHIKVVIDARGHSHVEGEAYHLEASVAETVRTAVLTNLAEQIAEARKRVDDVIHVESKQRS